MMIARRNTIKRCAAKIVSAVDEVDDLSGLDRVLTLLTKALASLNVATSSSTQSKVIPFDKKDHFGPTQKNETQLSFKQTTSKPGRKRQLLPIRYVNCHIIHAYIIL